jgi:hypothetical protein
MSISEKVKNATATTLGCIWYLGLSLLMLVAWLTHIFVCFQRHYYGFLIAGAIVFPIAVIHGIGLWFGWWS